MQGEKKNRNRQKASMAITHFRLPFKKDLRGKNEIYPTNEQIFASFYFIFYIF